MVLVFSFAVVLPSASASEGVYLIPQSQMRAFVPTDQEVYPSNMGGSWFATPIVDAITGEITGYDQSNAQRVIDGNARTVISAPESLVKKQPYVTLDLGGEYTIYQVRYQPLLNAAETATTLEIQYYAISINNGSPDNIDEWVDVIPQGSFPQSFNDPSERVATFSPIKAKYVRFKCRQPNSTRAIAELNVAFVDKSALSAAIADAEGVAASAVVGSEEGEYAQAVVDAFASAIALAKSVYNADGKNQNDINGATEALSNAKILFFDRVNLSNADSVESDKSAINLGNLRRVTKNLMLPSVGKNGSTITWISSNTAVIKTDGTVTRPAWDKEDAVITLTATISKGASSDTVTFTATVISRGVSYQGIRYSLKEAIKEDYEDYTLGKALAAYPGWNVAVAADPLNPANKVGEATPSESTNSIITPSVAFEALKGIVVFEMMIYLSDESQKVSSIFSTANFDMVLSLSNDGMQLSSDGVTDSIVKSVPTDQWHFVRLVLDMNAKRFYLHLNEDIVADGRELPALARLDYPGVGIQRIAFAYEGEAATADSEMFSIYTDDMKLYEIVDKRALETAIDKAALKLSALAVGSSVGEYTAAAKLRLESALEQARVALESEVLGQAEIDSITNSLKNVVDTTNPNTKKPNESSGSVTFQSSPPVISLPPTAEPAVANQQPKTFKDIESHWAREDVNYMIERNIVKGIDEESFEPDRNISRAEFTVLVVRAFSMELARYENIFTDVAGFDWYGDHLQTAVNMNIISRADEFRPDADVTREEMGKIIISAGNLLEKFDSEKAMLQKFADAPEVSDWAVPYMECALQQELMLGVDSESIMPKAPATRAQAVVVIKRMITYLDK